MAALFGQTFISGFLIPATLTSAYEVPASLSRSVINNARVHNYGPSPEAFTIQIVPSSNSSASRFIAIEGKSIAAGETILLSEIIGEALQQGDAVFASASTVTTLSLTLGGTTFDS